MAGLQTIKNKAGSVGAYRLTIKTPGASLVNLQLPATMYTKRDAEQCRAIAEDIETAYKRGDSLQRRTTEQLEIFVDFKKRLVKKGLIDVKGEATLSELFAAYFTDKETTWSAGTTANKANMKRRFLAYFPESMRVNEFSKTEAQQFKMYLEQEQQRGIINKRTAAGIIREVKALFNWAVQNEIIDKSPFAYITGGAASATDERKEYIELSRVRALIDVMPTTELQALLWIVRRLGLRCQSETNALKWAAVDFNNDLITIDSPKTASKGKAQRVAPLFPDVKDFLLKLRNEQRANGIKSPFVFIHDRKRNNARNKIERAAKAAGVVLWVKLFQNMRLSASVDILRTFGNDAEALWVGHTPDVRALYYRGITSDTLTAAKCWHG